MFLSLDYIEKILDIKAPDGNKNRLDYLFNNIVKPVQKGKPGRLRDKANKLINTYNTH